MYIIQNSMNYKLLYYTLLYFNNIYRQENLPEQHNIWEWLEKQMPKSVIVQVICF